MIVSHLSNRPFDHLRVRFLAHDHRRPEPGETAEMLTRVEAFMNRSFTPAEIVEAVDHLTEATIWLVEDNGALEGIHLWVPLNPHGEEALLGGRFDHQSIDPSFLARSGEPFSAIYHWGFCGFTANARRSIMRLCGELHEGELSGVNIYARIVTDEGDAAARRLGSEPCVELGEPYFVHRARPRAMAEAAQ